MDRQPVSSSNMASIGFDKATGTLEVEWLSGRTGTYSNVTEQEYQSVLNAGSVGRAMNEIIKPNHTYTPS